MVDEPVRPRRRRALADAGDENSDDEVDSLLLELGIPTNEPCERGKRSAIAVATLRRSAAAAAEVIELLTPPREASSPRTPVREDTTGSLLAASAALPPQPTDRPRSNRHDRRASIVDLTSTPSPSAPASVNGTVAARVRGPATTLLLTASSSPSECAGAAASLLSAPQETRQPVTIVNLDSDERSDSDVELDEIFSTGLRRAATQRPPALPPSRSLPRSFGSSQSNDGRGAADAHTPPPLKRRRTPAVRSPAPPSEAAIRSSSAASPGRLRTSTKTAAPGATQSTVSIGVSVRLERSLDASEAGQTIRQALQTHVYCGKALPVNFLPSFDCKYPRVVVLNRGDTNAAKDPRTAGAGDALPYTASCAIWFDAHTFLELLLKEAYTGLTTRVTFLSRFADRWQSSADASGRRGGAQVFVIVEKMDRALVEHNKKARKAKRPGTGSNQGVQPSLTGKDVPEISFADLSEVAFQLFMDLGAHVQFTCDSEASASYVAMVAREMIVSAARKSSEEEFLESVPRFHSFRVGESGATTNDFSNAWLRMLQTIPGVSEDKAQSLVDHFPTLESLIRTYHDPTLTLADKEDLLTDKLHRTRFERALSKRIYSIFTAVDPAANLP